MITDAQVHLWASESAERPWLRGGRQAAPRDSFSAEELLEEMDEAGVDRVVLVPPSFEGDRNDYCLDAALRFPGRFAVMGRFRPDDPASASALVSWRETRGTVGVRLTAFTFEQAVNLLAPEAERFWASAEDAEVPVALFTPGSLGVVGVLARRYGGIRFLVDHLGIGTHQVDESLDSALADLAQLASLTNVAVKASCLPNHVTAPFPFETLVPRIRRVIENFGPSRVFWGSDLTRSRCSYTESLALFTEHLGFLSPAELRLVLGEAIAAWLPWPQSHAWRAGSAGASR